jgi:hypothetical protein
MDFSQINIFHVICTVVVANLAACPVNALNLDDLAILDPAAEWDYLGSVAWFMQ